MDWTFRYIVVRSSVFDNSPRESWLIYLSLNVFWKWFAIRVFLIVKRLFVASDALFKILLRKFNIRSFLYVGYIDITFVHKGFCFAVTLKLGSQLFFLQLKSLVDFWDDEESFLFCPLIILPMFFCAAVTFMLLRWNSLCNLLADWICLSTNFRDMFPMLVKSFLLNGGRGRGLIRSYFC